MTDISQIQTGASQSLHAKYMTDAPVRPEQAAPSPAHRGVDHVDFSPQAADAARRAAQGARTDLVERIRHEIKNDAYDTDAKLSLALDRMIDRVRAELT